MARYRKRLPQLGDRLFLADAGLETMLSFQQGLTLPSFAAFVLLQDAQGWETLRTYYTRFVALARSHRAGVVLETPTWRANADWGHALGYGELALAEVNRAAVALLAGVRAASDTASATAPDTASATVSGTVRASVPAIPIVISGNIGPRGDGYRANRRMSPGQARDYHLTQIATFAATEADMVGAFTIPYPEEAIGIVDAAAACEMPVAVSFTLETDGRLPSGDPLMDAIVRTDAETGAYAAYYMVNCAHPSHIEPALAAGGAWRERIRGLRPNASRRSHAELDESTELDDGDPQALGEEVLALRTLLPRMTVVGGCCGTDERHIEAMARRLLENVP